MYGLQDEFDKNGKSNNMKCFGKTLWLITFLKVIYGSSSIWDKVIYWKCVFWSLKFTKLSDPQLAFLQIIIKKKILKIQDRSLLLIKIILGNNVEECTVESSACIGLDDMEKRSDHW